MLKKFFTNSAMLIFLFVLGISTAMAQSGTVQGTIVDANDGTPLPGATVQVKGTTSGTVTDLDGKYSITVEGSVVLRFSYVGLCGVSNTGNTCKTQHHCKCQARTDCFQPE